MLYWKIRATYEETETLSQNVSLVCSLLERFAHLKNEISFLEINEKYQMNFSEFYIFYSSFTVNRNNNKVLSTHTPAFAAQV
jgi:hypothetical protein